MFRKVTCPKVKPASGEPGPHDAKARALSCCPRRDTSVCSFNQSPGVAAVEGRSQGDSRVTLLSLAGPVLCTDIQHPLKVC